MDYLEKEPFWKLAAMRKQLGPGHPSQDVLAPPEHQAWVREYLKDYPMMALAMPALIPGYQAGKALLPKGVRKNLGMTDPSMAQMAGGYRGLLEWMMANQGKGILSQ